jgi:hypothetical protein
MARILIAEDEDTLRELCARALATDGHEVKTACDGGDALDVIVREEGQFDLLITDIRMPIMDGIALALSAARRAGLSRAHNPSDDRLCRPARTRPWIGCDHPRRDQQAVLGLDAAQCGE